MNEPSHIGLILDGSRRYAKSRSLPTIKGHEAGANTLQKILEHIKETSITQVSIYAFSTENFNRSKEEVDNLMQLFLKCADELFSSKQAAKNDTKIIFIGNKKRFSQDIQQKMSEIETNTHTHKTRKINVGFGYGGRDEIVRAVQHIVDSNISEVTEQTITDHLDLPDQPDLIIRTGGVVRTSNFLPWQSVYSEWFFIEKYWPEFTTADLDTVLQEFCERKRRFGK